MDSYAVTLDPLIPVWMLQILCGVLALAVLITFFTRARGAVLRTVTAMGLIGILLNPSLTHEVRDPLPDVAVIVRDQSTSQTIGPRTSQTDTALAHLTAALEADPTLDLRILDLPAAGPLADKTTLLTDSQATLADIPPDRFAGLVLITDGQIHDAEDLLAPFGPWAPVHVLLTGEKDEIDRQLRVVSAPEYGIVGETVDVTVQVEDINPRLSSRTAIPVRLTVTNQEGETLTSATLTGQEATFPLPITRNGQNVYRMTVDPLDGEVTALNNTRIFDIRGVRDRLRVLLVSGRPYTGARTWRNLLKSDPGVDLVHFTILRPPHKQDATPLEELSLIAFPVHELFDTRLNEFDLIVFDQYQRYGVLRESYFRNIAEYVEKGGAILVSSGPEFLGQDSIYRTALSAVLTSRPGNDVVTTPFHPLPTDMGQAHPVTAPLALQLNGDTPPWGQWLRQISLQAEGQSIVLQGGQGYPLLTLDRVGTGRVAHLASDQIWLWSRAFEGGGPHTGVLRRLVHWLMKEPELEEQRLDVVLNGETITVTQRDVTSDFQPVEMLAPDGESQTFAVTDPADGYWSFTAPVTETGLYTFQDDRNTAFVTVGGANAMELADMVSTPDVLAPLTTRTGGGIIALWATPTPDVRRTEAGRILSGRAMAGNDWIALRQNNASRITGIEKISLMPALAALLAALSLLAFTWWREGRS